MTALAAAMARRAELDRTSAALAVDDECRVLCNRLRQTRERHDLSQVQLGGQMGVPGQMVGEWERCEVMPSLRSFVLWARALDREVGLT